MTKKYDYLDRLIRFAGDIILLTKKLPNDIPGNVLSKQIIRSGTSAALNFGETQGTVTTKDYISKASICLKELRETEVNLKIMAHINYGNEEREQLLSECVELIKICSTIIKNKQRTQSTT